MEDLPQVVSVDASGGESVGYDPAVTTPSTEDQVEADSVAPPADSSGESVEDPGTDPEEPASDEGSADADEPAEPAPDSGVPVVNPTILERYPHDGASFTQGLEFGDGLLIESLGLVGESSRRKVEPTSGEVVSSAPLDSDQFGAGLTVVDTRVIQLTWQQGVAVVADLVTLIELGRFTFAGEGWGLCSLDDGRLVMSNGSGFLTFRDSTSFEPVGELEVTRDGNAVENLNELECVGTSIYANVWLENDILEIDATTGAVTRVIDASALVPDDRSPDDVLNGIAYRADTNTFFLTGKRWTVMYEVSFG